MKKFLQLNWSRLILPYLFTGLIFLAMVLIIERSLYYSEEGIPDDFNFTYFVLFLVVLLPLFLLIIVAFEWLYKHRVREKAFSIEPFNKLEEIGFSKLYINQLNKMALIEETKCAKIGGYFVSCFVEKEKTKRLEFRFDIDFPKIYGKEASNLLKEYKEQNLSYASISLFYNTKETKNLTIADLKTDLENFAISIKEKGFEPIILKIKLRESWYDFS